MFNMTSILRFNNVQFSLSWSTTILLTAILKLFGLLKSEYKSMHLKLCESSIIRILFLHYACNICCRFSFKIQFTTSAAFCFDIIILKTTPLNDVINDLNDVNIFPTFHALETYGISLSNDTWHFMITLELKYLFNFKSVSDILNHPIYATKIPIIGSNRKKLKLYICHGHLYEI